MKVILLMLAMLQQVDYSTQVVNAPTVDPRTFNFSAANGYSASGTITGPGAQTVNFAVCPRGVSGSDASHYVYVADGGESEAVLITGGNCAPGSIGTLQFTTINPHSSAWSLQSATAGFQEAENSLPANGGTVLMPPGNQQMQAPIYAHPNVTFTGVGSQATRVIPASCSALVFGFSSLTPQPAITGSPTFAYHNIKFRDFMIDAHSCNGANTVTGFGAYAGSDTSTISLLLGLKIDSVWWNNVGNAVHIERGRDISVSNSKKFANGRLVFTDSTGGFAAGMHSSQIAVTDFTALSGCAVTTDCSVMTVPGAVLEFDSVESVTVQRISMESQGPFIYSNPAGTGVLISGFSEDWNIDRMTTNQMGISVDVEPGPFVGSTFYPGYGKITNCAFDGFYGYGVYLADGGTGGYIHNVQMVNNTVSNKASALLNPTLPGYGTDYVYIGYLANTVSVIGGSMSEVLNGQTGIHIGPATNYVSISGVTIDAASYYYASFGTAKGIQIDAGSSLFSVMGNVITVGYTGTQVVDNSGTEVKTIAFNAGQYPQPSAVPAWFHVSVKKIANGTAGCTNANGCWQVSNPYSPVMAATAGLTQYLALLNPLGGASTYVHDVRMKTATACTGTTTFSATLGSQTNPTFFLPSYDLMAAVSVSNFVPANGQPSARGSGTFIDYVLLYLTSTGSNVDQVVNGCAVDVWLLASSLPN